MRPAACLHVQFDTPTMAAAYVASVALRVPQAMRVETQDEAFARSRSKSWLRSVLWSVVYCPIGRAFFIGELNRRHLLRHGFRAKRLMAARYCVVDGVRNWPSEKKMAERARLRNALGVPEGAILIGFCGKFIPKKDPELLLDAFPEIERCMEIPAHLLYLGSGELEGKLHERSRERQDRIHFGGFINQSALPSYYLAMDVFVLPSRQQGETWGLVVNEALQAGCGVVVSAAVGSSADFGAWERCRVIPPGDSGACARAVCELSAFPRDFEWCAARMAEYSMKAAAGSIGEWVRRATEAPQII